MQQYFNRDTPKYLPLFVALLLLYKPVFAQDFYGSGIQEVKIELPHSDWAVKLDSLKKNNPDMRLDGSATVNGVKYADVGVRFKGNSSYNRTRNETLKKLPFNVKLNFKNKTQELKGGQGTIKLSNAFMDPSFIRDPLCYEVIRNYMPAPRCNFSKLYVNKSFYGLYINTESVDEVFIKHYFGTNAGFLVKCDPDKWTRPRSQSGCPKGENASLMYLNDSPGCYDAFYEVDDAGAWKPLLNLIKTLNKNPKDIESVLNVDQALWMLAINNITVNLDSYNGSLSHNYYLWFDTTGVAHPIIWDLNMAFGGWRRNFSFAEMPDEDLIQLQPLSEINNPRRPLISQLLKNSVYRKIYLAHYKTLLNDFLINGQLMKRAEDMLAAIDPIVQQDSLKLYTYEDFKNSMDKTMTTGPDHIIGIRQLMAPRTEWLKTHALMLKVQPTITEAKHQQQGSKWTLTAHLDNATEVFLNYRYDRAFAFKNVPMHDDGEAGDAAAGDGVYTAVLEGGTGLQYYISAVNSDAGATLPERASFEFFDTAAKKK